MVKILQATSRGQITLPKEWRDNFDTKYYKAEIKDRELIIIPLKEMKTLEETLEYAWQEYKDGKYVDMEDLMKEYGL